MQQQYLNKKHSLYFTFFAVIFAVFINSFNAFSQTTIINPTSNGGFESGNTFALNGWTNTAGTNKWIVNTGATAGFSGTRCAYINNTATNHNYSVTTASVSHIYRDITIPAAESNINLSFKWIGNGESCCDRLRVWVVPTTVTPVAGTAIASSGVAPTGNIQIGLDLNVQSAWTTANLALPNTYAGTTVRLVFEWRNDGSVGAQPPAAVDDISLISSIPTAPCTYSATSGSYWINNVSTTGGYSNINNPTTFSVGGYGNYFPIQTVNQSAGGTINFNVGMSSGTHGINVYVDWNNDFDFSDAGEKVYASGAIYVASAAGSFAIPGAQANGSYRMRVVAHFLNTDPPACSSETYTEAEDYKILVTVPPTCYIPNSLTANASSTTAGNATWVAPSLGTAPAGYQYVITTINATPTGSGTPIATTNVPFTGLTPNTTYYVFVRSDCGSGDFSSWSGTSFFTGYCFSTGTASSYYINNFSTSGGVLNITNNASGNSATGYGNFTSQIVSQVISGSVGFSTTLLGGTASFNIWVDWNNDLDFNDIGEQVYASPVGITSTVSSFIVPSFATIGNHRMRIIVDGINTVLSPCGNTTFTETEDYTLTVLPQPLCSGNPSALSVFLVSGTSSTISWVAGIPAPSSGYQYFYSSTNNFPSAVTVPSGSVAAGVTTTTLTGLTAGNTYYFWVRSNCTASSTGTGSWVGTAIFTQPTCALGTGTGPTTLACPNVISGGLGLSGAAAPPINCSSSGCANLEATFSPIKQTTSYTVSSIPYVPPYQFNCMRNPVSVNIDDRWSPLINLPFNFCFYGNTYNSCVIGSNGVLTFDASKANTSSGYSFANNLPSTVGALFANSIYGVYHDIDPSISGGEVGYELITLNTGCRALVASWNNIAMFSSGCNAQKYTGMMVLYENTNIIDVYIKEKRVCAAWNGGNAIVGIQDATGTIATVATNRNGLDPDWTTTNEAWRFTPAGANVPTTIKWYEGTGTTGPIVGTAATVSVCPAVTTNYTAEVTYTLCSGLTFANTAQTTVTVTTNKVWNGSVNTDWNVANNWTPNVLPTLTESVNIPNVANKPVIGSGVNALACSINVATGSSLTINTNNSITVTNAVNVAVGGIFNIKNNASLVQVNNVVNSGNINMERIANLKLQDYCYWSSPVGNLAAGTFPLTSVSPSTPASLLFKWDTTGVNANGGEGNWVNTIENMIPGKGYIARAPVGLGYLTNATTPLTANFIGRANNGIYTIPIIRGNDYTTLGTQGIARAATDDNWNLIGNPYPSALGVNEFLSLPANSNIVGGVRIWRHLQQPTNIIDPFYQNFTTNYFSSDYLTVNLTGMVSAPGDYKIGSGQGFMVLMLPGAPGSSTLTFNNGMRSAAYANNQFFRSSSIVNTIEQNRIWLDLVSDSGIANRTLVGYVTDATNEEDRLFDMFTTIKSSQNFYSLIGQNPMLIQGKALPFDANDLVPMGMKIPTSGNFTIAIATADGIFQNGNQTIYLEDKTLNTIHNLTLAPYQFTSNAGIINDRFVIRYSQNALAKETFNFENQVTIYVNNGLNIKSSNENIKNIEIYDVLGRTLFNQNNIGKNEVILSTLRPTENVMIVKITLQNDTVITRKVLY
jgi:GEVED domain